MLTRAALFMLCAAALSMGCADTSPTDADPGSVDGQTTGDTGVVPPTGCQNDAECAAVLGNLGACRSAVCDLTTATCKPLAAPNGTNCDDGDVCTSADQCDGGACKGSAKPCNDDNPCTNDTCNPATGNCEAAPNAALCDDGNLCTKDDQCSGGKCQGQVNEACQCQADDDCKQFDDADLCNGILHCVDNQCVPKPGTEVTCPEDDEACMNTFCDALMGACRTQPMQDGTGCDDGDQCTLGDACKAGNCIGDPTQCDDGEVCTDDTCDPANGCVHNPNAAACDDGDLCTTSDACAGGTCQGTPNPACDCIENADCAPFEDGNLCNGSLVCTAGECVVDEASVVDCTDEVGAAAACVTVSCEPTTGQCASAPSLDGGECDDGDACTQADHCEGGACVGTPSDCGDDNPCTTDACDPATGCTNAPADGTACDDDNPCTADDTCSAGQCTGTGECACETAADCADADDGDQCNGTLECLDGQCQIAQGSVVTCPDSSGECTAFTCLPATGECIEKAAPDGDACNDDDACTSNDVCDAGQCTGQPVSCDDGQLCTDDSCASDVGCVHEFSTVDCDDGIECTIGDRCTNGTCTGTPEENCGCETTADCADLEDGNLCNGTLICSANKCVIEPATVVNCAPADNDCQQNECEPATGQCVLSNAADGKPCDDGSACTSADSCSAGACVSGEAVACDDGNPCTDDSCAPDFGCVAAPNTATCDDNDPCTVGDTCSDSACQPGAENQCATTCQAQRTIECGEVDAYNTGDLGGSDVVDTYSCSPDEYPGNEFTYLFTAPFDGTIDASLSNESSVTDILVLEQTEAGCDPQACMTFDYSAAVGVPVEAGKSYYLVVDGFFDEAGDYALKVDCTPAIEQACDDGVDDDDDGDADCDDADCALAPECLPPQCDVDWTLSCGSTDSWGNYLPGSTDAINDYDDCENANFWSYWAPEYTYTLTPDVTGPVTVTLSNETASTHVMVIDPTGDNLCQGDKCIRWGADAVTFDAVAGTTYYVVVDGLFFAEGTYTIDVDCAPPITATETSCTDGLDDDGDGLVDCEDGDCFGSDSSCQPACIPDASTDLSNLECPDDLDFWNNGGDGSTDLIEFYGCAGAQTLQFDGPEYAYTFDSDFTGPVTVSLANELVETDIIVLQDKGAGCNPASCIDWGTETVTFDAEAGTTYYILVDGFNGAEGSYNLTFVCGG